MAADEPLNELGIGSGEVNSQGSVAVAVADAKPSVMVVEMGRGHRQRS